MTTTTVVDSSFLEWVVLAAMKATKATSQTRRAFISSLWTQQVGE